MSRVTRGIISPTSFRTPQPRDPQFVRVNPEVTQFRQLEQILAGTQRAAGAFESFTYSQRRSAEREQAAERAEESRRKSEQRIQAAEQRRLSNEQKREATERENGFISSTQTGVLAIMAQTLPDEEKYRLIEEHYESIVVPEGYEDSFVQARDANLSRLSTSIQSDQELAARREEAAAEQLERTTEAMRLNATLKVIGDDVPGPLMTFEAIRDSDAVAEIREAHKDRPEFQQEIDNWADNLARKRSHENDLETRRTQENNRVLALSGVAEDLASSPALSVSGLARVIETYPGTASLATRISEANTAASKGIERYVSGLSPQDRLAELTRIRSQYEMQLEVEGAPNSVTRTLILDQAEIVDDMLVQARQDFGRQAVLGIQEELLDPSSEMGRQIMTSEGITEFVDARIEEFQVPESDQAIVRDAMVKQLMVLRNQRSVVLENENLAFQFDIDPALLSAAQRTRVFDTRDRTTAFDLASTTSGFDFDTEERKAGTAELGVRLAPYLKLARDGITVPTGVTELFNRLEESKDAKQQVLAVRLSAQAQGSIGSPETRYAASVLFRKRLVTSDKFDQMAADHLEDYRRATAAEKSEGFKKTVLESLDLSEVPAGVAMGIDSNASEAAEQSLYRDDRFRIPFLAAYTDNGGDVEKASNFAIQRLAEQRLTPISDSVGNVRIYDNTTGRLTPNIVNAVKFLVSDEQRSVIDPLVQEFMRVNGDEAPRSISSERYTLSPNYSMMGSISAGEADNNLYFNLQFAGHPFQFSLSNEDAQELLGVDPSDFGEQTEPGIVARALGAASGVLDYMITRVDGDDDPEQESE